jgi:cell wall-associated NlpC family hydrolase
MARISSGLPMYEVANEPMGAPVDWDRLQPSDIVFCDTMDGAEVRKGNAASHVGIFVHVGQIVNVLN